MRNSVHHLSHPRLADLGEVFGRLEGGESCLLGEAEASAPEGGGGWLGVRSSGTTGAPRIRWHRWEELKSSAVAAAALGGWTWATPFRADSFAGVQVALQAWVAGGRCLALGGGWGDDWGLLARERPEVLSATPTYTDLLLLAEPTTGGWAAGGAWSPRQLTLGGEPLRPGAAWRIRARFPAARWTVVYASADVGLIAKTHREDGWFSNGDLCSGWAGHRVVDGRLELERGGVWMDTGDRVEPSADGFRVLGRAGAVANVGGTKVALADVEALAESVPGVQQARARAVSSGVSGEIVGLRYAVVAGMDSVTVRGELERVLRAGLRREAWPRVWEETSPGLGPNGKKEA